MEAMMHYTPEGGIQHNIEFSEGLGIVSAPIVGNPLYEHPPAIADNLVNVDLFSQPDGLKYQHRDCNTSSLPRSRKAARHHRQRQK